MPSRPGNQGDHVVYLHRNEGNFKEGKPEKICRIFWKKETHLTQKQEGISLKVLKLDYVQREIETGSTVIVNNHCQCQFPQWLRLFMSNLGERIRRRKWGRECKKPTRNEAIVVERYYIRGACMLKRKEERGRALLTVRALPRGHFVWRVVSFSWLTVMSHSFIVLCNQLCYTTEYRVTTHIIDTLWRVDN